MIKYNVAVGFTKGLNHTTLKYLLRFHTYNIL